MSNHEHFYTRGSSTTLPSDQRDPSLAPEPMRIQRRHLSTSRLASDHWSSAPVDTRVLMAKTCMQLYADNNPVYRRRLRQSRVLWQCVCRNETTLAFSGTHLCYGLPFTVVSVLSVSYGSPLDQLLQKVGE